MPARLWPPTDGDAASAHELSLVCDVATLGFDAFRRAGLEKALGGR
jgi:hypothetical protein